MTSRLLGLCLLASAALTFGGQPTAQTLPACTLTDGSRALLFEGQAMLIGIGRTPITDLAFDEEVLDAQFAKSWQTTTDAHGNLVTRQVPVMTGWIYVVGKQAGSTFISVRGEDGEEASRCAIAVHPIAELMNNPERLETMSCRDPDGTILSLTVGGESSYSIGWFVEVSSSDSKVAELRPITERRVRLTGLRPGLTTLTAVGEGGKPLRTCLLRASNAE